MVYQKTLYAFIAVVIGIIILYTSVAVYRFFNQSKYVYFPTREIISTPSDIGLLYEDIFFKASDGVTLSGWYIPVEKPRATILVFHGNGGNISNRLEFIKIFNQLGLTTFIIDYRGYGKSQGEPSEEGTYLDAQAAWDYLVKEKKINPYKITLFGRSLGGPIASWLAKRCNPRALILDSTFTSIKDVGAELYPYLPVKKFFKFDYNTIEYLKEVSCPVLIIHSINDNYIPFSHGVKLFEEANEPKKFLKISGTHNDGFITSKDIYIDGLNSFMSNFISKI